MHKKIKAFTGMKRCTVSSSKEDKDGEIITESIKIIKRQTKYIEKLFQDDRGQAEINKNIDGPKILQSEVSCHQEV